jgi:ACS family 4-hydroxyphenylacetate permease-like MFS transporter
MERKWHVALGLLAAAGGWILMALQDAPELKVLGLVFCVAGTYAAQGVFWSIPPRVFSDRARPAGIAFVNACGVLASALSPLVIGFLRDLTHGWVAPLMFVTIMLVNSSVLVVFAVKSKDRAE